MVRGERSVDGWTPFQCCRNIDTSDRSIIGFNRLAEFISLVDSVTYPLMLVFGPSSISGTAFACVCYECSKQRMEQQRTGTMKCNVIHNEMKKIGISRISGWQEACDGYGTFGSGPEVASVTHMQAFQMTLASAAPDKR
jgi:hypothetical protein